MTAAASRRRNDADLVIPEFVGLRTVESWTLQRAVDGLRTKRGTLVDAPDPVRLRSEGKAVFVSAVSGGE